MGEWVVDASANYPEGPVENYANTDFASSGTRLLRGGFFNATADHLLATHRHEASGAVVDGNFGFRCARNP